MFDLGIQELVVIFVVALLVFGPKRLPELARNMGKGVAELKKAMFDIRREIDQEVGDVTKLDLEHLSATSDDLKRVLEEKAKEAAGYNDDMLTPDPDGPSPDQPDGVQDPLASEQDDGPEDYDDDPEEYDGPEHDDDPEEEDDPEQDDTAGDDAAEDDTAEDDTAGDDTAGDDTAVDDTAVDDTAAKDPDDPYGGLSAEERVDPEEDEQEYPGQSRESNA